MDDPNVLGIYSIFDKKSLRYDNPFFAMSDLFAKRRYMLMLDEKGPLRNWPEDFELMRIGTFNIANGELKTDPKLILEGKSIVKKET